MMAKPMKTLELHYPMIHFLIININNRIEKSHSMVGRCEESYFNFKLLRLIKYFIETLEGISFIFISTFMCSKVIIFGGS